jgi:hypothetical protein
MNWGCPGGQCLPQPDGHGACLAGHHLPRHEEMPHRYSNLIVWASAYLNHMGMEHAWQDTIYPGMKKCLIGTVTS